MSSRQAVVLASRVLCVYFLYSMLGTLISLPLNAFALSREWHMMHDVSRFLPPAVRGTAFGTSTNSRKYAPAACD